jgi:hypothetical protein
VIADPVGVTWGLRAAANGKDPGRPIIVMGGDHGDVPLEGAAVGDLVWPGRRPWRCPRCSTTILTREAAG